MGDKKPIISLNTIFVPTDRDDYTVVSEYVEKCVIHIKDNYNVTPYIYTRQNFWNDHVKETPEIVKECPLWIARWRDQEPSPAELSNGWNEWTIWHHSNQGSVPGITGNVDLDKMKVCS